MLYTNDVIKKRKRKIAKIKSIIVMLLYMILIPFLVYNVSLIVQAIVNPNKTPSFFGIKMYVIISGSMEPELQIGDVVIVKETNTERLNIGDIISFRKGQTVVTHRIEDIVIEKNKKQYRTKGDNNNIQDPDIVSSEQIEGKLIQKIPFIGNLILKLKDKTIILTIVIIYYIYLLHDQSIKKRKMIRTIKRDEYEEKKIRGD